MAPLPRPVVLLVFANNRVDPWLHLPHLPEEKRRIREALTAAEQAGLCEIVERTDATVKELMEVFQNTRFRDRIAIFHFGGHADSGTLLFETAEGAGDAAYAEGLARLLGEQRGLELVFLNGCSSRGHVQGLLDAGVPSVIATSQPIADRIATEFSPGFYRALASGASLRTAYVEAVAALEIQYGASLITNDMWPWGLHVAPGAEDHVKSWSLPSASKNFLYGLPPLAEIDLPPTPFKHLASFTRADAPVFFGRGREIRELFEAVTAPDGEPIVLLFGATGVGKSSLLAAGLQPRLEASYDVLYLRREKTLGLAGSLAQAFAGDVATVWRRQERETGRPLVVILDQVEEAWTRPLTGDMEAEDFAALLHSLFAVRERWPQGRLLLGFRKEWLAEVWGLLDAEKLPRTHVELHHPDRDGIVEAVAGLASSDRLKRRYR